MTNAYFSDFLVIEEAASCFSFMGVILTVIEYDLEYDERNEEIARVICWIIFLSSIFLAFLTMMRYQAKLEWLKSRKSISDKETLFTSGMYITLLFELLVSFPHPTPFTINQRMYYSNNSVGIPDDGSFYYHVNEILSLISMIRVLFIFRTVLIATRWYNNRSQRVCGMYACENDYLFVIKCLMKKSPYTLVFGSMTISIFWFGYLIRVCEGPLNRIGMQNFHAYSNSMWNIIITMTTVGYGDYFPITDLGRFIIFIVSIWGVTIVSIMVVTLITT